eukprot:EG_transcript_37692
MAGSGGAHWKGGLGSTILGEGCRCWFASSFPFGTGTSSGAGQRLFRLRATLGRRGGPPSAGVRDRVEPAEVRLRAPATAGVGAPVGPGLRAVEGREPAADGGRWKRGWALYRGASKEVLWRGVA